APPPSAAPSPSSPPRAAASGSGPPTLARSSLSAGIAIPAGTPRRLNPHPTSMMATRPLPEPTGIEYVPYVDDDEDDAVDWQPQAFRPTLAARPKPPFAPARTPVSRLLPKPAPAVSPSMRTLLPLAAGVVLLVLLLVLAVHSHTLPAVAAAAHARHPEATEFAPGAVHPAKPSAYGEAFNPAKPVRKPRTRPTAATTPSPAASPQSALH